VPPRRSPFGLGERADWPTQRTADEWRARLGLRRVIVPVPRFGVPAAMGYSSKRGIPFELGIIRNHRRPYLHRADEHIRHLGVK